MLPIQPQLYAKSFLNRGYCFGLSASPHISQYRKLGCHFILSMDYSFLKDFIHLFLERGEGREKERDRNINVRHKHQLVASHTPPTGDLACNQAHALTRNQTGNPSICGTMPNPPSHISQGSVGYSGYSDVQGLVSVKCCQNVGPVQVKAMPLKVGGWLSTCTVG